MSVWIEHPDLPGRVMEVSELSLPHHRAAGWVVTKAPEKPKRLPLDVEDGASTEAADSKAPETNDDAADGAASSKTETESPRRRRASTKED